MLDVVRYIGSLQLVPALLSRMQRWPRGDAAWPRRVREWLTANAAFKRYVLRELELRFLGAREVEWP